MPAELQPRTTLTAADRLWVEAVARDAGFDLAGLASVPQSTPADPDPDDQRFAAWVASGAAGEMAWLTRRDEQGALVRGDLRRSLPWARSVLVCAVNYHRDAPRSIDPAPQGTGWIARYAWSGKGGAAMHPEAGGPAPEGSDYHEELLPRLEDAAQKLRTRFGEIETRCYVDTGPILERGFAARAGVGWIGRNTCVLNQKEGSWLLLGVVVTSLALEAEAEPVPAADRCGTCTRCIDACPTDALHGSGMGTGATRQMDATRCIAYLTIEKKGTIEPEMREAIGRQVFGCDICQDVCPWNSRAPVGRQPVLSPRAELINPSLAWLASLDGPGFQQQFRGSPLERTRRRRLMRNVAIAMGNSRYTEFKPQLKRWSEGDDPVLAEAAQWALDRLVAENLPAPPAEPEPLQKRSSLDGGIASLWEEGSLK